MCCCSGPAVHAVQGNEVLLCPEVLPCWQHGGRLVLWGTSAQAEAYSTRMRQQLQLPEQKELQGTTTPGLEPGGAGAGASAWQHMWEGEGMDESQYSSLTLRVEVGQVR